MPSTVPGAIQSGQYPAQPQRANPVTPQNPPPAFGHPGVEVYSGKFKPNLNARVPQPACDDEAAVMKGDRVVLPQGAEQISQVEDVDEDQGTLSSLYPGQDVSTDAMFPLPCTEPIGGTLPNEANADPSADEVASEQYLDNFESTTAVTLTQNRSQSSNRPTLYDNFTVGPCKYAPPNGPLQVVDCDSPDFLMDNQPFEGRDIIFVNGLAIDNLKKWLAYYDPAHQLWPQNRSEFISPNGYFRQYANTYWRDHIRENLYDPDNPANPNAGYEWTAQDGNHPAYVPKANRYMIVAWSSNQPLEYGQDAFLYQVMLAMTQGTNVVTPPNYPRRNFSKPFCANGCIVISHSTGGLLVASALGLAAQGNFGPGGRVVAKHIRAHVAFSSATSGSRLATIAVALGTAAMPASAVVQGVLCPLDEMILDTVGACSIDTGFLLNTVLVDLIPQVAQGVWGPAVNASPVPTVTVAGGHTVGDYGPTGFFLPGIDDGVVTMNSACGNPAHVYPPSMAPSGIVVDHKVNAFDMGQNTHRAISYYLAMRNLKALPPDQNYMAGTCTPWLSAMGMIMPVSGAESGTQWSTTQRYHNYFSFLQGSIDHAHPGGGNSSNPWPSAINLPASAPRNYLSTFAAVNNEEMSAITDPGIYQHDQDGVWLVNPGFVGEQHQFVRGKRIKFKLLGKWHTWWIWRRNYILLGNYPSKSAEAYVYQYVERR